ncbi:MAG: metal-sensing transcriptional repressor [Patescibacteria group bacterium]
MPKKKKKQTPIQSHLNRIIGQTQGVKKMLGAKTDNILVIGQIMAAKASLEQLAIRLLREESKVCHKKRIDRIVETFFKIR